MKELLLGVLTLGLVLGCTKDFGAKPKSKPLKQTLNAKSAEALCQDLSKFSSLEKKLGVAAGNARITNKNGNIALHNGLVTCKHQGKKWVATVNLKNQRDLIKKPNFYVYHNDAARALCGELRKMNAFESKRKVSPGSRMVLASKRTIRLAANGLTCRKTNEDVRAYISF